MTQDLIQGTLEWHQARLGKLTASRFHDAIAKTKSGWSTSRAAYIADLAKERRTGRPVEAYKSFAMQQGTERQPDALLAYQWERGVAVTEVGFIPHPRIAMAGCSPDGFVVGTDGLVEVKCPLGHTHSTTVKTGVIPNDYLVQIQWQLACTGRWWCDYVSFDPTWDEEMQLFIKRVERDDKWIEQLEQQAEEFLAEVDAEIETLRKLRPPRIADAA